MKSLLNTLFFFLPFMGLSGCATAPFQTRQILDNAKVNLTGQSTPIDFKVRPDYLKLQPN